MKRSNTAGVASAADAGSRETGLNSRDAGIQGPINNSRPAALFQQVKNFITERIESGEFPPNARIPSENDLVKSLGVSRMTAHRAMRELTADGILMRVQGVGTFVAASKPQSALLEIRSISDDIARRGGKHSSDVHLLVEEVASREVADSMDIPRGSPVFHSIIVHRDDGRPVQLADRYVNPAVAPLYLEQDFTRITPSEYLFQMRPLTEAEHIIEAVMPDRQTRKLLEIGPNEPCLLVRRRTWCSELIATKARLFHPGSGFQLAGRFKPPSTMQPLIA